MPPNTTNQILLSLMHFLIFPCERDQKHIDPRYDIRETSLASTSFFEPEFIDLQAEMKVIWFLLKQLFTV